MVIEDTKSSAESKKLKNSFILLIGMIIVLVPTVVFITKPIYSNYIESKEAAEVKRNELEINLLRLDILKRLSDQEEEIKQKNEKVLSSLPTENEISILFLSIEGSAEYSGLNIKKVSEENEITTTGDISIQNIEKINYEITGSSSDYENIKSLMNRLESGLRLVSIDTLEVKKIDNGLININMSISAYKRG